MNLVYIAFFALGGYFLSKTFYKGSNNMYIYSLIAIAIGLIASLVLYRAELSNLINLMHFYVTSMSITFLLIVCYEVLLLEWRVNKVKKGEIENLMPISIEKNYNYAFKLAGLGMIFLTLALLSGILITEILTINIQLKALFTFISWLIYFAILIVMTFFNLKIKYAVRGLVFTLIFVLVAYMGNAFIFSTIT